MKFERVYEIASDRVDECKKLFGGEWSYFMDDVSRGTTQLYLVDGYTYYAIMPRVESIEIVLICGKNLREITEHVTAYARSKNIKTINAWSGIKGMHRIFESFGAELTNTYHEYTLRV